MPLVTYTVSDGTATATGILTLEVASNENDIGSLILLANSMSQLYPIYTNQVYWLLPFREPGQNWHAGQPYIPSRLSMYGKLLDYELYLTGSLHNQIVSEQKSDSFTIPFGTFRHTNPNEQLKYTATKLDGSALPNWLHFDPKKLTFTGVPPKGATTTEVLVKAKDNYGKEAFATFKVTVNKEKNDTGKKLQGRAGYINVTGDAGGYNGGMLCRVLAR